MEQELITYDEAIERLKHICVAVTGYTNIKDIDNSDNISDDTLRATSYYLLCKLACHLIGMYPFDELNDKIDFIELKKYIDDSFKEISQYSIIRNQEEFDKVFPKDSYKKYFIGIFKICGMDINDNPNAQGLFNLLFERMEI